MGACGSRTDVGIQYGLVNADRLWHWPTFDSERINYANSEEYPALWVSCRNALFAQRCRHSWDVRRELSSRDLMMLERSTLRPSILGPQYLTRSSTIQQTLVPSLYCMSKITGDFSQMSDQRLASPSNPSIAPNQPLDRSAIPQPARYAVIIRLPFPRNGFDDPPPVEWSTQKDRELWKIISTAPNANNLNWADISSHLDVPLSFLLQQAAWFYEQHFEGMKLQMQRLGGGAELLPAGSGISGNVTGGASMRRTESGGRSNLPPEIPP